MHTNTHIYKHTKCIYHFVLTHRKTLVWCFSFAFVFLFNFFYSGSIACVARLCLGDPNEYTKLNLSHHGAEYLGQFVVKTDNVDWEGSSVGRSTCYVRIRTCVQIPRAHIRSHAWPGLACSWPPLRRRRQNGPGALWLNGLGSWWISRSVKDPRPKNKMEIREQNVECKGKTFRVDLGPLCLHLAASVPIHRWTHHTQLQILIKVKRIPWWLELTAS